ncbi:MAG TPA: hypothetical protein VGG68_00790 [Caulobacteraceae bacterium]|jgi:hypothetical protein
MKRIDRKVSIQLVGLGRDIEALYREADTLLEGLGPLFDQIDEKRREAAELMEDEANVAEEFYDGKSERWQEGEKGSEFSEWKDQLRSVADDLGNEIDCPKIDLERPDWLSDITNQDFEELPE